jgi:Kef-type K+ transport system membrane component KefB
MMSSLFSVAVVFAVLCRLAQSSELLGCFFAGLAFSSSPQLKSAWPDSMQHLLTWSSSLFFACSIGFGVPSVNILLSAAAGLCTSVALYHWH